MSRLASRRARLVAPFLIAAVVLVACMPAADRATTEPLATSAAPVSGSASSASPSPTADPPQTEEPAPSGDAVTGGEPAASGAPSSMAEPGLTATPLPQRADQDPGPFAMNLFSQGDFVAQYTFEWCVGASLQMAINLSTDRQRTSRADQQDLWEMARDQSFSPFGGANPMGWTAVLNELGIGPYELVSIPTLDQAFSVAAEAIRARDRPVGLVMWRGRHAWVMSGFESTADPRETDVFDVTGIRVLDPLYPNGSSVWGASPKPNSLVSPETLAKQFVVRDVNKSRVDLHVPTGYLMILPVLAAT